MKSNSTGGQSLIEILIVMALTAILMPALFYALMTSREGRPQQNMRFRASQILKETQDSLRVIRENGWSAIATPGTYHPVRSGNTWVLSAGPETVNGITRQIVISNVNRLNSQIVSSGGSNDPSTKQVVITVSWTEPHTSSISSTLYLTRYLENAIYTQTTVADFETGTYPDLVITSDADGEMILGAGGQGSWCAPDLEISATDLPKNGVANALTAIEGLAFAATGENASGVSFARVTINQTPEASVQGTFDGYKTNDVFGEQDYAYIATDNNGEEIVIINLATMTKIGWYNASGSESAESIFVHNNRGYMTQGNDLRIFDLSSKSGARNQLGTIALPGNATALAVQTIAGTTYAYISISGNTSVEMQIVDVTNAASPALRGTANLDSASAQDISINDTGTRAYVATSTSSTQREFFIVDISTKTGVRPTISSYDTNGMSPKAITIVPGNKAIIVGVNGEEYQVINIATETNPVRCGGIEVNSGINDIASVLESEANGSDAYSYILTGDAGAEFKIIEGGPGGSFSTNGTYESETFDIGQSLAFNRILPTATILENTNVTYQIAIADPVSGSCAGADYVFTGPDGTDTTSYSGNDLIAFSDDGTGYENPGRCFRYRATLTTDNSNSTPIFEQIIINYSY